MTSFRATKGVRSWGGVLRGEHQVATPAWRDELPAVLDEGRGHALGVLPCGARRSYGDSGVNPGGALVDMTGLDRVLGFDPLTRIVRAEGGVSFDALLRIFLRRGLFLPVTPGTRFVTLAGAIANDVHGKNHHVNGTIGQWIRKIGLLTSGGDVLELSPESDTGLFQATIGGLGLTGIIAWADLELMPVRGAIMDVETISFANLDEFFQVSAESERGFDYTVAWVDSLARGKALGRGTFSRANHAPHGTKTPDIAKPRFDVPFDFPNAVLNKHSVRAFNFLCYHNGRRKAGRGAAPLARFFYPLDAIGHWNRMYGGRGLYQYQSVVPPQSQVEATREMLGAIAASGQGSFLSVVKTFAQTQSPGLLSFPMAGTTLALDFPNRGSGTLQVMARLDAIVREAKGRLYPAKDGRMSAQMFRLGYPNWEEFAKFVDPHFSSHFWRRVAG